MSDSESDYTHISFNSIIHEMNDLVDAKLKLDIMFKEFTNRINNLNYYIGLYERHEVKHLKKGDNDSNKSGKKKFCSNVNNVNDDNNNNNNTKKHRTCAYNETDPAGRDAYKLGETELERHRRLRNYEIEKVEILEKKEERRKEKENKKLEINMIDQPENTSSSSSDINSTDTPLFIINPTSSPVIPTPTSKDTIIQVRLSNGKHLPNKINSDNNGIWTKISKQKADSLNISSTSNDNAKLKRKRKEIQQADDPSFLYTKETSVPTTSAPTTSVPTTSVRNSDVDVEVKISPSSYLFF
jgi:hypothetical protein